MKVLVLHNNNLPDYLLLSSKITDVDIKSVSVKLPETDVQDFDTFISDYLSNQNEGNPLYLYDVIVLPYNTTNNDLEYTGLRIAAHIRLTKEWNCMSKPILFLGPDTFQEINQFSELGCLLNSFNVFMSSKNKQEEIIKMLSWIKENTKAINNIEDSPEYKIFLNRMKCLSAPANYSTHHSLANEWAIMRWNDMMTNPVDLLNNDFTKMLYYKYLRALYGDSQKIKIWLKKQGLNNLEKIENIEEGKRLVLIDDEWNKGWADILAHIAEVSGFEFDKCEIKKEWDRDTLVNNVNTFVDNIAADCFLLDLRLHDSDFDEVFLKKNSLRLSGYEILDHIKEKNEANSVVVFSASNKIWNFKNTVWDYKDEKSLKEKEGALDYVLKETPESSLSARESYKIYSGFVNAVRLSFRLSKLKEVVTKQNDIKMINPSVSSLEEFIKLVLLDKGQNKHSIIKACLMCLMTFLEDYIKERYEFVSTGGDGPAKRVQLALTKNNGGTTIDTDITKHVFVKRRQKENSTYSEIIDSYYTAESSEPESCFTPINDKDTGLLLSVLYVQYNFSSSDIKKYFLPIKNKRNTISHESKNISLEYNELYDFYFKIIVPIIEHDHK